MNFPALEFVAALEDLSTYFLSSLSSISVNSCDELFLKESDLVQMSAEWSTRYRTTDSRRPDDSTWPPCQSTSFFHMILVAF